MFFHPCRDVCQVAWDLCSYCWIIWSKWEIELCVISVAMVGDAMRLYDGTQWCSVCGEEEGSKNRSLGNPSDQFMCFGYLPSPGHLERPTSETSRKDSTGYQILRMEQIIDKLSPRRQGKRSRKLFTCTADGIVMSPQCQRMACSWTPHNRALGFIISMQGSLRMHLCLTLNDRGQRVGIDRADKVFFLVLTQIATLWQRSSVTQGAAG